MATYVVATIKSWNLENFKKLAEQDSGNTWVLISDKADLTPERLAALQPRYVFFPHWSWIIPAAIYNAYECVVFHMADLPYGRGGSPLQNLIVRGHTSTKISALRVTKGIDEGPVYTKRDLSLTGSATEIFTRFSKIVFEDVIPFMVNSNPQPSDQTGEPTVFARRTPEQSNLMPLTELAAVYDYIRMLDAEGYPKAYLENDALRFEFDQASASDDAIVARVVIRKK